MDVEHELVQLSAAAKSDTQNIGVSQLSVENPRDSDASALARLGKKQVLKVCQRFRSPCRILLMVGTSTSATSDSCRW